MMSFNTFRAFGTALLLSLLFLSGRCCAFINLAGVIHKVKSPSFSTTIHQTRRQDKAANRATPTPKLVSETAEELARAAIFKAALSHSGDHKLDSVHEKLDKLNLVNFNQKIIQINQKLDNINRLFKEQGKLQRIEFAIEHSEHGSFDYRTFQEYAYGTAEYDNDTDNSSTLVKAILFSFRMGRGHYLPQAVTESSTYYGGRLLDDKEQDEEEKKFRDCVVEQIFLLTGTKPRITRDKDEDEDDRYCIWYS